MVICIFCSFRTFCYNCSAAFAVSITGIAFFSTGCFFCIFHFGSANMIVRIFCNFGTFSNDSFALVAIGVTGITFFTAGCFFRVDNFGIGMLAGNINGYAAVYSFKCNIVHIFVTYVFRIIGYLHSAFSPDSSIFYFEFYFSKNSVSGRIRSEKHPVKLYFSIRFTCCRHSAEIIADCRRFIFKHISVIFYFQFHRRNAGIVFNRNCYNNLISAFSRYFRYNNLWISCKSCYSKNHTAHTCQKQRNYFFHLYFPP